VIESILYCAFRPLLSLCFKDAQESRLLQNKPDERAGKIAEQLMMMKYFAQKKKPLL
jgi:hypothetical protein